MADWQPIETAPKDGTEILLFELQCYDEPYIATGIWHRWDGGERWLPAVYGGARTDYFDPTHWMPLPDAPEHDSNRKQNSRSP